LREYGAEQDIRDDMKKQLRRVLNNELYALYSSQGNILRWAGHVARMGERRGTYRASVGKPEGRRPLGRLLKRTWEDNIKNGSLRLDRGGINWIDRYNWWAVVNTVINLWVP
jgi:hypothetical protein